VPEAPPTVAAGPEEGPAAAPPRSAAQAGGSAELVLLPTLACKTGLGAVVAAVPTPRPPEDLQLAAKAHALKALLDISCPQTPQAEVLDVLRRLEELGPLSTQVLRSTLIGKTVNALLKRTRSGAVREQARALLCTWRDAVRDSPAAQGDEQPAPRLLAEAVPPGVDPEVWPQIPASCRAWALASRRPEVLDLSEPGADEQRRPRAPKRPPPSESGPEAAPRPRLCTEAPRPGAEARASERDVCVICISKAKTHAFVPCGHQCVCKQCGTTLLQRYGAACPVCRCKVHMIMQIFR